MYCRFAVNGIQNWERSLPALIYLLAPGNAKAVTRHPSQREIRRSRNAIPKQRSTRKVPIPQTTVPSRHQPSTRPTAQAKYTRRNPALKAGRPSRPGACGYAQSQDHRTATLVNWPFPPRREGEQPQQRPKCFWQNPAQAHRQGALMLDTQRTGKNPSTEWIAMCGISPS